MILYNTLMGFCAGLILILTARAFWTGRLFNPGYGLSLIVLGLPLSVLSGLMAVTWPLEVNPPINIAFAEPALMLGVLSTIGGLALTLGRTKFMGWRIRPPISIVTMVFSLGLMLAAIASAIFSYNLVGDAPPQEPITGQFTGWENTTFGIVYSVAALGCLATPWANTTWGQRIVYWSWMVSGVFFLVFSILNYRTHIGLLINFEQGTNYRW
jgi:hypothetical protein